MNSGISLPFPGVAEGSGILERIAEQVHNDAAHCSRRCVVDLIRKRNIQNHFDIWSHSMKVFGEFWFHEGSPKKLQRCS